MRKSRNINRLYDTSLFDNMSVKGLHGTVSTGTGAAAKNIQMKDSGGGLILSRNLEYVLPEIYEQPVANMTFMGTGIGVDNQGKFKDLITKLQKAYTGNFNRGYDRTDNKGRISVELQDDKIKNFDFVASMGWSQRELERAQQNQNFNLVAEYLISTRNIYMQEIDEIGYTGISDSNGNLTVGGLLNNSVFTSTAAGGTVGNLSDTQLYELFRTQIIAQHTEVDEMEQYTADMIVTPRAVKLRLANSYNHLTNNNNRSILKTLEEDLNVKFMSSFRTNTGAFASSSRTAIFAAKDQSMMMRIPDPLNFSDVVQVSPDQWEQKAYYECAGLDIIQENTGRIITGL